MPIMQDQNGNPVIVSMDQMVQRLFDIYKDSIRVDQAGKTPEVQSQQPAAAGAIDVTLANKASLLVISSTVDAYVRFDQTAGSATATNGLYIPAKVPVKIPVSAKVVNVYATGAGTITVTGLR